MPLAFKLPTTSYLALQEYVSSSTHPSLPHGATSQRVLARRALKEHKRLHGTSKDSNLGEVLTALSSYIPYLLALDSGLSGHAVAGEEVQVDLEKEVEVEWRMTWAASVTGREPARVKLRSFEYEVLLSLSTLAATHYLLGRSHLHGLYNAVTPSQDLRVAAVSAARKSFLEATSIYASLSIRVNQLASPPPVPDISSATLEALALLCRAETTLVAVLKDDPYISAVIQDRNPNDKDWMFKAPDIPKVRAHLFARLCIAAAEHANRGSGALARSRDVSSSLTKYIEDLKKTARGKACRFLGIDAELSGMTGEGIGWLRAANRELGFANSSMDDKAKGNVISKLKKGWNEKREDRKVEKGLDWGSDAGRLEEARVVDMLLTKWTKMNDTMSIQTIPPSDTLLAKLPSGREIDSPAPWQPPSLDDSILARLRALPDVESYQVADDDSDDDQQEHPDPVGAFPGTGAAYAKPSNYY